MTIEAVNFDRGAGFTIDFSVAVIVLCEVAIVALHSFFEVDVGEVNGFAETVRIVEGDLLAIFVEPVPLAVVMEDRAKNPSVAMKIGELCGFQLLVKFGAANFL